LNAPRAHIGSPANNRKGAVISDKPNTPQQKQTAQSQLFAKQAQGAPGGFFGEFWYFLRHNKKWWLTPVFFLLLILGTLVVLGASGAAPFIYHLF
jgi:hypothetical protein